MFKIKSLLLFLQPFSQKYLPLFSLSMTQRITTALLSLYIGLAIKGATMMCTDPASETICDIRAVAVGCNTLAEITGPVDRS